MERVRRKVPRRTWGIEVDTRLAGVNRKGKTVLQFFVCISSKDVGLGRIRCIFFFFFFLSQGNPTFDMKTNTNYGDGTVIMHYLFYSSFCPCVPNILVHEHEIFRN